MTAGRIVAIVGPSGVGKDTLIAGAVARDPGLHWARRVITRPELARPDALGGEPFLGVDAETFRLWKSQGRFILDWRAHGLDYGIPIAEFAPFDAGRTVLFNGSRAALPVAMARFPALRVIRIMAPSHLLAERLASRGRETPEDIRERLSRATYDIPAGMAAIDVNNDTTPDIGIARLLAALQPLSA